MEELKLLIINAQNGDLEAYDQLVHRYQDMAVAYGYSVLGDFHLAQDVAQEAFVEAFFCLPKLQEPMAFSGWLRRIVFKHCDRMTRNKRVLAVSLDAALGELSLDYEPYKVIEEQETASQVRKAIATLPQHERSVTVLFYMGQHSQSQIAEFLEVPVTTVKKRLHTARKKLKEKMIEMIQENLEGQRPSRNSEFAEGARAKVEADVAKAMAQLSSGDADEVSLRQHHPLARFRDPHPVFHLYCSLLSLALTNGATGMNLTPSPDSLDIQLEGKGVLQKAVTLPKALQEPLVARLKDAASLDVTEQGQPQTGSFQTHWQNQDFEMLLSFSPNETGEHVSIRFVPK